jgi:DNA replication ATP-dependent helicase Dna2
MVWDKKYGSLLLHNYLKIAEENQANPLKKMLSLYEALYKIITEITDESGLTFFTLFTRIAYIGSTLKLQPTLLYNLHYIRKNIDQWAKEKQDNSDLILRSGYDLLSNIYKIDFDPEISKNIPPDNVYVKIGKQAQGNINQCSGVIIRINHEDYSFDFIPENTLEEKRILYNVTGTNDLFNDSLKLLNKWIQLPIGVSLLDIEIDEAGYWTPSAFVLLPDYLIDVTAISDSIGENGVTTLSFILRKFSPTAGGKPILIGHVANYFLDELLSDSTKSFKDLCSGLFKYFPLAFASMNDAELRQFFEKLKPHYLTIQRMAGGGFAQLNIDTKKAMLEPTFYSVEYGIQGRLDLFYAEKAHITIVELKSGKPFRPNKYGLSHAHYLQTLMYDLLVRAVYPKCPKSTPYILYSSEYEQPMRYAPVVKSQQYEALNARNELLGIEWQLCAMTDMTPLDETIFYNLKVQDYPGLYGFQLRDLMGFENTYHHLSTLEKRYFNAFSGMIAREHRLAKIGNAGREGQEGQAALWQKGSVEKESAFEILQYLEISVNKSHQDDPLIRLTKTIHSNELANFRTGDIVVLYPNNIDQKPLKDQLIKCSIAEMGPDFVVLRLRAKQNNKDFFKLHQYWNLESDWLDSSFLGATRSLYEWATAPHDIRSKVLGLIPPQKPNDIDIPEFPDDLTAEQKTICKKIVLAEDIMLLWGPPGTGKTSKVLHHVIKYLMLNTAEKLLVMAYTNRAVDEICEAIEAIDIPACRDYIRIGSRYGTSEAFQSHLLDRVASNCNSRSELLDCLTKSRIVVGTIASIQGKPEIFQLMSFDRLIIDEASQILEPSMAGLLTRFQKSLLIGDHLQLPAVVTQSEKDTHFTHQELTNVGFMSMRDSLFERLLRQYKNQQWDWAYAQLSYQGRMHNQIMQFPNQFFYNQTLNILPENLNSNHQMDALPNEAPNPTNFDLPQELNSRRVVFIPVLKEPMPLSSKTNEEEAIIAINLVKYFRAWYIETPLSIGIITPFRAQIATIRSILDQSNLVDNMIQVDTVERFQGGAKDIVIISLCVNSKSQLKQLISKSMDGVDRKLNVALTRAKKHLIVIGNPAILEKDETYDAFMKWYTIDVPGIPS